MRHNPERDLHDFRRGAGVTKRFDVKLPMISVSARTSRALRTQANTLGISLGDAMREALSAYTGIPAEEPNTDNMKRKD